MVGGCDLLCVQGTANYRWKCPQPGHTQVPVILQQIVIWPTDGCRPRRAFGLNVLVSTHRGDISCQPPLAAAGSVVKYTGPACPHPHHPHNSNTIWNNSSWNSNKTTSGIEQTRNFDLGKRHVGAGRQGQGATCQTLGQTMFLKFVSF